VITTDDGVRLFTRVDGLLGGPTLLLLNSLGADLSMWDPQVEAWGAARRVIRFDQRGHGCSQAPPPPYTIERLGRDALAVLDAYEAAQADLCGVSLGGLVALWVAGTAPSRVRRAVFADTATRIGTEEAWRERAATVRREGMAAVVELALGRFFSSGFRRSNPPAVAALELTLRSASVDGYSGSCEALATADLSELVGQVHAPSLVVVGTADEATPPSDAARLLSLLRDARSALQPGAGHLASLEQPERFGHIVDDFLTDEYVRPSLPDGLHTPPEPAVE
jgi:3-oxoadipate enol-lactonase